MICFSKISVAIVQHYLWGQVIILFTYPFFENCQHFNFCIGIQPTNKVVIVSGEQYRNSAIHKHISILPQTLFPSRWPHNIEQSSICYTIGPCWLSILNTAMYCTSIVHSKLPNYPLPSILSPSNHKIVLCESLSIL